MRPRRKQTRSFATSTCASRQLTRAPRPSWPYSTSLPGFTKYLEYRPSRPYSTSPPDCTKYQEYKPSRSYSTSPPGFTNYLESRPSRPYSNSNQPSRLY